MLSENDADIHAKNGQKRMALHLAAEKGYEAVLQLLIKNGVDVHEQDGQEWTAPHLAAEKGHEAALQLLIKNGASIHAKDSQERTALHLAAEKGHEAVLRLLIKNGADVHAKTHGDLTALYLALQNRRKGASQVLIENGANIDAKDFLQQGVLEKALVDIGRGRLSKSAQHRQYRSDLSLRNERREKRLDIVRRLKERLGFIPTEDDNVLDFPRSFLETVPDHLMPKRPTSSTLCASCGSIRIGWLLKSSKNEQKLFDNFHQLRASAVQCDLCKMILPTIEQFDSTDVREINVIIAPQFLILEVLNKQPDSYGFLRLCTDSRE